MQTDLSEDERAQLEQSLMMPQESMPLSVPPGLAEPESRMDNSTSARVAPEPAKKSGGLNLARALYAFGGGDINAYDRNRREAREAPLKLKMQQQELADKRQATLGAQQERTLKSQELRDSIDPKSELSKSSATQFAQLNAARADLLQKYNPRLAQAFADAAFDAAGRSRIDIVRSGEQLDKLWKNFEGLMSNEAKQALAGQNLDLRRMQVEGTLANAAATRDLARAAFADKVQDREQSQNDKAVADYGKAVGPLRETEALLNEAKHVKKGVNTGKFANFMQTKILAPLGLKGENFTTLEAIQGTVNNAITKLQSGGNVTSGEAERLRQQLAMLDQDDREFEIKLKQMMTTVANKISQIKSAYPKGASIAEGNNKSMTAPHGQRVRQNGHEFEWNGSKYVEVK